MRVDVLFESIARGEGREGHKSPQRIFCSFLQTLCPPNWPSTLSRKLAACDCLGSGVALNHDGVELMTAWLKKLGVERWGNVLTMSNRNEEISDLIRTEFENNPARSDLMIIILHHHDKLRLDVVSNPH